MRIVGDVHAKIDPYIHIVKDCDYSLQIGDMGFSYDNLKVLDYKRHKFFGGNHDNYDIYYDCPHAMGSYGFRELGGVKFYFVRGAFSINKKFRVPNVSWWKDEEIPEECMEHILEDYIRHKPDIVITHDCPRRIADIIGNPGVLKAFGFNPDTFETRTQICLNELFEAHQPSQWFFGHFHKSWSMSIDGTVFTCLNELEYKDI